VLISSSSTIEEVEVARVFTAYKTVDRRVHPVPGTFPQDALVRRTFPHEPLKDYHIFHKIPPNLYPPRK
jgi:hypothetical protein